MVDGSVPGGEAGWEPLLDDLEDRRRAARAMGGPEKLARRRDEGGLDARARIAHLLDPGSFVEIGTLVGSVPADGLVAGSGTIQGRHVMVGAEDFTVLGGSIGAGSSAKRFRISELAELDRIPLVMLLEGAGHRPPLPDEPAPGRAPTDLIQQARLSGRVPLVTGVLGASAGHGALVAPISDFSVMTLDASIFAAGPPVVKASLGEDVSKQDLGGPGVAVASGLVHNVAADDRAVLDDIRTYLSYFPSSAWSHPPRRDGGDTGPRRLDDILGVVPRDSSTPYDVRLVVSMLVDEGRFFQVQPDFGSSMVCALAHLGGEPVAVVANQPQVMAGAIDADAAEKAAHFVTVADSFHLPLVFLTDNPGMLAGTASEQAGILRAGARMFAAQTQARTVKLQVALRKAYGFGSLAMSMVSFDRQTASYALPGVTLGAMGSRGAADAVGADAGTAEALRQAEAGAVYRSAGRLGFDEGIDPRDLRDVLLAAL
ncbi:MAG TPA: acetyl-CoA carboxylase carboxyltransferase subunit, partial [Acidimicrobiaceae bacterium]|nr:acetyl-CoA carboxylase carboxyltransferase subunit [Acidimicrobiaceae bacterium]